MKVLSVVVSLLFASSLAAQSPTISSINPSSGPTSGGTVVAIAGQNLGLPPNFACIVPCPARVRFGDAEVIVDQETNTLLVATTPAHAAGVVDVTVRTGDGRTVTAERAFAYTPANESNYQRVLVPVYLEGTVPGGNGSLWETSFYLRNNSAQNLLIAPWVCEAEACPPVFPQYHVVLPGETVRSLPAFFRPPTANRSRILYLSNNAAADASMHLRIYDRSRDTSDAGAEIPLVREDDLLTDSTQLHGVPLQPRFRIMLRLYDVAQTEARFRVRVFEEGTTAGATPIDTFEVTATTGETGDFRTQAAYTEYAGLTSLLDRPSTQPATVRVEVEPLSEGSRYWTFIAITNNETQRTTLVTPQ